MGIGEEIQRIQEYLDGLRPEGRTVSLTDLMQVIIQGNMKEIVNTAGKLLEDALFSQAKEGQALLVQVAVLGLTGAVFSHAASAFKGSQIPETAFYMIYLLIFTCLAGSFLSSIQITAQVLDQILEFVRLLMPAYFISVAFAGEVPVLRLFMRSPWELPGRCSGCAVRYFCPLCVCMACWYWEIT